MSLQVRGVNSCRRLGGQFTLSPDTWKQVRSNRALRLGPGPLSGGRKPIAAPGTDPNAAWTCPRLHALNDKANRPVDFPHATHLQQPFRETHVVVECTVHDPKPIHPFATYILDLRTRDLRAHSLQDPTCLEIRACAH